MLFPYFAHTRQESKGKRYAAKRHSHQPVAREGGGKNRRKFWVKLFSKSFEERRLFEKRRHPKIFIIFYQWVVFK
ncbi:hypothetical protein CFR75_04815 [Komagataeibacter xylinus]|uniref:Uncharacterized protein n=1 Tax=Komagataeibacter xylinus TaxID=28448 RepID=A0A318PLB0_KOMXY|nr:hypothetical protein [Komagataeibacter xylinus]PYD57797.1 hypothetical protein CFR75_04815 [Komagataeibacter xylinus]